MDLIERAGENSFLSGEGYRNPYKLYSDEFNRYERGWTQAVKKSEVGLLPKPVRNSEKEFPIYLSDKEPVFKPPINPDAVDAYRKRKG